MTFNIHAISTSNSEMLNDIAPDVFDHEIIPEQLQTFLNDPRHLLFVATDDGVVVGMASEFEYFHPDKQPQLFINEVGVTPTHRKRGIGKALIEAAIDAAKERDCVFAWLGTETDNFPAQACFGSVPNGDQPEEFLLYEWNLKANR